MKKIEQKINDVYNFIFNYVSENGFSPSIREICAKLKIKSTATAYSYLERLQSKGLLERPSQKKRAISLMKETSYKTVPLLGVVRAGEPIFAVENLEGYYPIPEEFNTGGDEFALTIKGDSMINAGIFENDVIIVNKQNTANNGEIVVALVDDGATVKRFYKTDTKFILHPENDNLSDMIFDEVKILGVVKGLMRKF
jgi:repressor LexA